MARTLYSPLLQNVTGQGRCTLRYYRMLWGKDTVLSTTTEYYRARTLYSPLLQRVTGQGRCTLHYYRMLQGKKDTVLRYSPLLQNITGQEGHCTLRYYRMLRCKAHFAVQINPYRRSGSSRNVLEHSWVWVGAVVSAGQGHTDSPTKKISIFRYSFIFTIILFLI